MCRFGRSFVVETHPVIVVNIRALYAHLPRYHDGHAAAAVAGVRRRHVVTVHTPRTDRMNSAQATAKSRGHRDLEMSIGERFGAISTKIHVIEKIYRKLE